jgi:ankyrin repeat protein
MRVTTQETTGAVRDLRSERRGYIERWLSPPDPSTNYNNALQKRHECSGIWFLESDTFAKWKTRRNSFLWLNGIPGCGKTILSSAIIKDLNDTPSSQPLLYFYFDFNDSAKQTLESMVRSLVIQLQCGLEGNWSQLDHLYSSRWHQQPTRELLCKTLSKMIGQVKEVWIILDALDECRTRIGSPTEGLLSWIRDLLESEQRNVHLLVTSRPEPDIKSEVGELAHDDDIVPLQSDLITDDIRAYVHTRIREGNGLKRWRSQPEVQDEIETQIIKQADGMFRLAACQLDALENCVEYRTLQNTLASLPNTLDETYSRILHSIPSEYKLNATRILQFLTYSERPLRIEEAADAIAVDTEGSHYFNPRYRMPDPREITRFCSSLVVLVSTTQDSYDKDEEVVVLQLAHFSVKEYLTSERLDKDVAHSFQEVTAKASIATVCLAYLLHLDQNIQIEKIRGTFPLAQYSAKYWMDHAVVAEAKDGKLQGFIEKLFCHHRNSYWNCYSLYQPDRPWYLGDEGNSLPSNAQANIRSLGRAFPPPPMCNAPMGRENPAPALYYASFGGLVNAVQYILSQGADVNAQGGKYATALQAASFRGHEKAAKLLLKAGADVNAHGGEYVTALYAASDSGHEKIVELLLKAGANANAHGEKDGTALYAASDSGHEKIVELLLKSGADVNTQGGRYDTAPSYAASLRGHERVVELLLKAGADVNEQGRRHDSALFVASSEGHEKIVELLLKADTNANAQGGGYDTAIYAASVNGHERIVELLLKVNTGVNAQGGKYGAELSIASLKGHEKMVKLLLEAGADVNAQGGDYRSTALHSASSGGHEKVVKLLLEEGADVNAQDENNYGTALQVASLGGREKVVELLLKAGADVNAVGGCYGTALQAASFGGYGDVIKLLLKAGANANVYGGQYGTALHAASFGHEGIAEPTLNAYSFVQIGSYGHSSREKIVELLLNAGANVNAQGGNYGTALQIASLRGREKVVKLLLKAGADANAAGGEYVTALHAASFKGHEEVVELLLKQGTDVIARVGSCSHGRREKVVEPPLNAGADANAQGGSDDTASPYAALLRSHERIVELLLKAGADANAQGVHSVVGCTELQAASLRGDKKVIELLLMRDSDTDSL